MLPQISPNIRIVRNAMCLTLLAGASACAATMGGPSYPVPDAPGIYAFSTNGDLRRLDGDYAREAGTWPERSNLPSNVQFVINEPALSGQSPATTVELWRLAWVRSEINAQGQPMPVPGGQVGDPQAGDQWAVVPLRQFSIPFRYESPAGQSDVVRITPTVPLEPGLYAVRIVNVAREARVGVGWNNVDQRQYSALNCVDRYPVEGNVYRNCATMVAPAIGALPAPAPAVVVPVPAPTASQPLPVATDTQGLLITLADPVRRNDGLLLQGVVINSSNEVRAIPAMQGSLENQAGQEVRRWVFHAPVATLAPGARTSFSTEVRPLPSGIARVNVAFIVQ